MVHIGNLFVTTVGVNGMVTLMLPSISNKRRIKFSEVRLKDLEGTLKISTSFLISK